MKKYLLLLLPMMAILLSACSKGYSLEMIEADYVTNEDKILKAEGENIVINVASTHSYIMTSVPSGACEFRNSGVVPYTKEGVAVIELEHEVQINPNTSGEDREIRIFARHRRNPEIVTSILFYQPAQTKDE